MFYWYKHVNENMISSATLAKYMITVCILTIQKPVSHKLISKTEKLNTKCKFYKKYCTISYMLELEDILTSRYSLFSHTFYF